jgi:glyoxylase-like metal-dependent hydrolase (beta-lactamase superfamily II)
MRRFLTFSLLSVAVFAQNRPAQPNQNRPQQNAAAPVEVHVLPVRDNIYMLVGNGGNTTAQVGKDGILLVDTQFAETAPKILAEIKKLNNGELRYIINTHYHPDHTGGNEILHKAGSTIAGGNVSGDLGAAAGEGAAIIAHENTANRLGAPSGKQAAAPPGAQPTSTFFNDSKKLYFNNEGIDIIHMPNAHTDGDVIVFFRRSDVIATGDLFTTTMYPVIDVAAGGTINGYIAALNKIIDLVIPVYGQEGGTMIVPGHGRLCDLGDIINHREMATIVRDRIQDMIKKGMTLDQVKAAKPTIDYDPEYGTNSFWGTDQFVEAVYKTLQKK